MITTVLALGGGPGCGKSTLAAAVYAHMKANDMNVELVREYVKAWAWRGDKIKKYDELYILAKQLREESNLYGKVDYVITDRPLIMSSVYDRLYGDGSDIMVETVRRVREMQVKDGIVHVDLLVRREKKYKQEGRFETESVARTVDDVTKEMFPHLIEVSSIEDVMRTIQGK
jgi:thymidylate kinase